MADDTLKELAAPDNRPTWPEFRRPESTGFVVLDLDKPRGSVVTVNGKEYRLRESGTLPPSESRKLIQHSRRIDALIGKDGELTPEEDKELAGLPNVMCRLVFDAPDAVHKKLSDDQRMTLVSAFLAGSPVSR